MNNATNTLSLLDFVYRIEIVTLPVLIIFGSICNIMTFIVMRRRRMRVSSTCFYMAALAVTDTLVLWTGCLNQWFYIIHIPTVVARSNLTCKLLPFLFVFFADASVWIIVCMSFERYFAVSRPLLASQMCTTKRAKWVLLIMLGVFVLIDGHFLLTLELEIIDGRHRVCHPKEWARHFVGKIFVFIDALKYSAIPFCILLILSVLIIQRVFHAQGISAQLQNLRPVHRYRQYSASSCLNSARNSSGLSVPSAHTNPTASNTRVGRRVTLMLLSVSIAFCVFSAPMSLMQIVQSIAQPDYYETPLAICKAVAELCQYVNHSCNFFLYALTGRIFRREFVRLFFPTRLGNQRGTAAGMAMNRPAHSARTNLIPQLGALSSRHGSLYTTDVNRWKIYHSNENNHNQLRRASQHLSTLYPIQYTKEIRRSSTIKSPLLASRDSPVLINRCSHTSENLQHPWINLWSLFGRGKERRATDNGSHAYFKALKAHQQNPATV